MHVAMENLTGMEPSVRSRHGAEQAEQGWPAGRALHPEFGRAH
jgi:hypothetical protein